MDTLRYYERVGLIDGVERGPTGQRRFSEDHLGWLDILKCLRDTGMPIEQMCRFAELVRTGDETIPARITLLTAHEQAVAKRIADLESQRAHINGKIDYYKSVAAGE
ncbi:MerR family transcriptional regulator [Glycomyces buryatensis]|uniref:MerR family transcriptional regulator n=2 Tax=Glycomyces buryatensis TaxID=2570927 RepID=A0A4S8PR85_9ACTN|nr:MerR family transcriptional regulator [Glycomyces buryatensis]